METKRERIHNYVKEHAGVALNEVAAAFPEMGYYAVENHLSHLKKSGRVYVVKRKYYDAMAQDGAEPVLLEKPKESTTPHVVAKTLDKYTGRELLLELKSRGYIWREMYMKKYVDYNNI